jgi:hypothetical protein
MIRINVIEHSVEVDWVSSVESLLAAIGRFSDVEVHRASRLPEGLDADAYLWIGRDHEALIRELDASPDSRVRRTVVIGLPLGYQFGKPHPLPGTIAALLEERRLGGAFTPAALLAWNEAPSFAGPRALMSALGSNAVKAFQSRNYANWFFSRRETMADFLREYLPILTGYVDDPSA